jgi:hypothetical protein
MQKLRKIRWNQSRPLTHHECVLLKMSEGRPVQRDGGALDPLVNNSQGAVVGDHAHVEQHFHHVQDPVRWPVRVGRPPLPADALLERPVLMEQIAAGLRTATGIPFLEPAAAILTGDGGTGETQLAVPHEGCD